MIETIGEDLNAHNGDGAPRVRIASVFPMARTVVAVPEVPLHAFQREAFVEELNRKRRADGKSALSEEEERMEMESAVDLFVNDRAVLIRPDPSRMDLAVAADELLQEIVPKRRIKFLFLSDVRVRDTLKRRGECWRMFRPPTAPKQIRQMINEAKSAIGGRAIYYHSPVSGTRMLTCENFNKLTDLNDEDLRKHLAEIAAYCNRRNPNGYVEVEFFMADPAPRPEELEGAAASEKELRSRFEAIAKRLCDIVPAEFQHDDPDDPVWRKGMFERLMRERDSAAADGQIMGLDPDFSMRVEWLPGGRIDEGELIMDPASEELPAPGEGNSASNVVNGLILNLVQEYGDMEYINLGSVAPSATRNESRGGRREVYIAQIKQRRAAREVLQVIRMQKWGVRENLDKGMSLEDAMLESEGYTEYILDRRLACRQLGLNICVQQTARKVSELYHGYNQRYSGRRIWSPYFQRDYITGIPTNQVPSRKLGIPLYALKFAALLGQAAASNIVLGRAELSGQMVFDVGDEIVVEDSSQLPAAIVVADQVGTFVDYEGPLAARAPEYGQVIQKRLDCVKDRHEFSEAYVWGFVARLTWIQDEYNRHRRGFDTLFKYRPWDPGGSLAYRWSKVLERLRTADAKSLGELIHKSIHE